MFGLPDYADAVLRGVVLAVLCLGWIILLVRLIGLRSFSKMTAFDFVITLATGSLLASATTVNSWQAFVQAIVAIGALMLFQVTLAVVRRGSSAIRTAIANQPLMLMEDGTFIEAALKRSRVSRSDVYAKLRAANAVDLSKVRAVILETTGDISILYGDDVDRALLDDVRGG